MSIAYLHRENAPKLAYQKTEGKDGVRLPTVVFLPGFKSDMEGSKAIFLEQQCRTRGQAYLRFDYSGHGVSDGAFTDGTIGSWMQDTLDIIDACTEGPVVLVGSSMGGWISLLVALERPDRVKGLIGIAAAPDFTKDMMDVRLAPEQQDALFSEGQVALPNDYSDEPYIITKALVEDGNARSLLHDRIGLSIPVRLVQGMKDADVEWQKAHRIKNAIMKENDSADVDVLLIEDGDHRLSREEDLKIIDDQVAYMNGKLF